MAILGGVYGWESNSGSCAHPASIFPTAVGLRLPRAGQDCVSLLLVLTSPIFLCASDPSTCAFCAVDMVSLATALEIFNEHDLQPSDRAMDVVEVIHCLTALYERLEEERGILVNVPLCVDMSLNWLLNVFDRYHSLGIPLSCGAAMLGRKAPCYSSSWQCCKKALATSEGAAWHRLALLTPLHKKTLQNICKPVQYLVLQWPQWEDEGSLLQDGHCMSVWDRGQGEVSV